MHVCWWERVKQQLHHIHHIDSSRILPIQWKHGIINTLWSLEIDSFHHLIGKGNIEPCVTGSCDLHNILGENSWVVTRSCTCTMDVACGLVGRNMNIKWLNNWMDFGRNVQRRRWKITARALAGLCDSTRQSSAQHNIHDYPECRLVDSS